MTRLFAVFASCVLALAALPACSGPQEGDSGGRVGVTATTSAERRSPKVLPAALIEFSDQAPARLIEDLRHLPEIANADGRVAILLGYLENKTQIVSSNDFEVARRRLQNNLINSNLARDKMRFFEDRARMENLAEKHKVADAEGYIPDPAAFDAATTFALNGSFFRISRGNTNYYYMEFKLAHFATNEIIWSDRYEVKQVAD